VLFSIWRMLDFKWTFLWSFALRKLIFTLSRYVITCTLFLMTWFTEMSITPAEPLWYVAAEFALVFDKICSVSFAGLFTSTYGDGGALTTDEFFFLEIGVIVTGLITCFSTTIIWTFAFETFIIGKGTHCEFLQIVIVWVTYLFESWFFIQIFKFCSFHGFFYDHFLNFNTFLDFFIKRWALFSWHSLFAIWAIDVIENYTRTIIPI